MDNSTLRALLRLGSSATTDDGQPNQQKRSKHTRLRGAASTKLTLAGTCFHIGQNGIGRYYLIPTLIELIAPRGFTYYSLAPSLTGGAKQGFGSQYWLTRTQIGYREKEIVEPIPIPADYTSYTRNANWEEGLITYSWWRINRGRFLEKPPEGSQ